MGNKFVLSKCVSRLGIYWNNHILELLWIWCNIYLFRIERKKLAQRILSWFNFDHWWTIFSCYEKKMKCISYTLIAIRLNSRGGQSTVCGPNPARDLNPTHGPNSALQDLLFDVAFETQACYSLCKNLIFYSCFLKRMARRALKN
jgi:hypothetical protein